MPSVQVLLLSKKQLSESLHDIEDLYDVVYPLKERNTKPDVSKMFNKKDKKDKQHRLKQFDMI